MGGRLRARGVVGWAAFTLCIIGACARLVAYLQYRSLWYDEAALAVNVVDRGFVALLAPLDYLQTAPPLFLWAERVAVLLGGPNEWTLRAVPLLAGIATPPLVWRAANRMVPGWVALVALALVACSPALVHYSAEVKPYAVDALVTVLLIDRALAAAAADASRATWWWLAIGGAVAVTASTPAVFVLAGVVAYLAVVSVARNGWRALGRVAALAAGWAVAFIALLATVFRPLVDADATIGAFMQWYWATNFLTPDAPGLGTRISVLLWAMLTNTFFGEGAVRGMTMALTFGAVLGLVALIASRRAQVAALLTVPLASLAVASALRRYPIAERLALFAAPLSAMLLASASLILGRVGERVAMPAAVGAVTGIALLGGMGIVAAYRSDVGRQETRALVNSALVSRATGTPVWVSGGGEPAWRFYSGDPTPVARERRSEVGLPGGGSLRADVMVGAWSTAIPERIVPVADDTVAAGRPSAWSDAEARRIRGAAHPCVAVFLSHVMPGEASALLASVARLGGRPTETHRQPGAELHRVCFDPKT